jgi:hypothetical protein
VKKTRGRNNECIDILSVHSLSDIGHRHGRRSRFDSPLCARKIGVDHYRNLGSDDSAGKTLDMICAHISGADHTNSQFR